MLRHHPTCLQRSLSISENSLPSSTRPNPSRVRRSYFIVEPNINAIYQRMANEVHKDALPGDDHVTAMEPIKDEFGLKTSATMTPGLLKVLFLAMASRNVRVQRRLLGLGTAPA